MKSYIRYILLIVITASNIFSFEIQCPYGCGELGYDPNITKIGKEFKKCLKDLDFLKEQNVPWFNPDYIAHNSFLTQDYEKLYENEGSISWDVEKNESYNEDQCAFYEFERDRFENEICIGDCFDFSTFNQYLDAFKSVQEDISFMYQAEKSYYEQRIIDLKLEIDFLKNRTYIEYDDPYFGFNNMELKRDFINDIKENTQNIQDVENWYAEKLNTSYEYQGKIEQIYKHIYDWCIDHHDWLGSYYQRGLLNFNNGNVFEALLDIDKIIEKSKDTESEILLLKGKTENELGLYHDAIISLSRLIKNDPCNKTRYFERAFAYFETGQFDLAINDFLESDFIKSTQINSKDKASLAYAKGLINGIKKGIEEGSLEFVPSMLASLYGLGHGLWALVSQPLDTSKEIIFACQNCINYLKQNTPIEIIDELVPELKELINDWDNLTDEKKGDLTGHVIGKYGIDILMTCGSIKAIKVFRDLKEANAILTLEKTTKSSKNAKVILEEAFRKYSQREIVLKNANLKIQWDKQRKHIWGQKNYKEGNSLFMHSNPQKLVNDFAGKGMKVGNEIPGLPGFKEIVNFEEFVGYDVSLDGTKTATTWGKIHYAKDGTHIVPTKPRN